MIYEVSVESLYNWVKKENYYGWDPYDALNSKLVQKISFGNPYLKILIIQVNKLSPINFRHLLKIEKGIDLKGSTLFAQTYCKMWNITKKEQYTEELKKFISIIEEKSLKNKYKFDCWAGHYFPYTAADKSKLRSCNPETIATCQAINALIDSYMILKEHRLKDMAISAYNFLIDYLFERDGEDYFFKYTPTENDILTLNASAEGLGAICHLRSIYKDDEMKDVCEKLARFLVKSQRDDGSWVYSIYRNGKVRVQLDFHQGYLIGGLLAYVPYSKNKAEVLAAIDKGAKFYKSVLFFEDGQSYYRYPMRYPTDIHNQAQGIITFSKLGILDPHYLNFAKIIAKWTISSMQDNSGYFYYQKWPFFINKIPYMRWSQAWMMLALSTLMEQLEDE